MIVNMMMASEISKVTKSYKVKDTQRTLMNRKKNKQKMKRQIRYLKNLNSKIKFQLRNKKE